MTNIYILLPVHNRIDITAKFIECLVEQTYSNYHLVLIDDGSTDGTNELVSKSISNLTIIRGNGDWWWAGSLHQGYKWLKNRKVNPQDIVLIINDDTIFELDFLEKAVQILANSSKSLVLSQCYSQQTQDVIDTGVHVNWQKSSFQNAQNPKDINCLSSRGLFLKVEDFWAIGGFYPKLLPHYTSDYEFTIRAHRKGYYLNSNPLLKLWLNENTTGNHELNYDVKWHIFLKQIFSIKSSSNPFFSSVFVILACPLRWKMINLFRVWRGFYQQCRIFMSKKQT
jgi:GT2 family glycosyltransferase